MKEKIKKAFPRADALRTRASMDDIEKERKKTGGRPNAGVLYAEKALARYKKGVQR